MEWVEKKAYTPLTYCLLPCLCVLYETPPPLVLFSSPPLSSHPLLSSLSLWLRNLRQRLIAECKSCSWANDLSTGAGTPPNRSPHGVLYQRRAEFRWSRRKEFINSGTVDSVREYTTGKKGEVRGGEREESGRGEGRKRETHSQRVRETQRERDCKPAAANETEQRGGRGRKRDREGGRWRRAPCRREGYRVRKKKELEKVGRSRRKGV